jgi:DNA-directed RNA polymerase I subunit RPA1
LFVRSRIGIENNPSPLQQMTFETAIGFLRSATLAGKCDTLDSPSARLVVGKPCFGGTGTFKMRHRLLGQVREADDENKQFAVKV